MSVFQVKKYKIIKNENNQKIQVPKSKEEWNKETKNGTMIWYFSTRYEINSITKQYKSKLYSLKREAEEEERLFLTNPIEYIKTHSKRAKNNLRIEIQNEVKEKTLNEYFESFILYKKSFIKESSIYEGKQDWKCHISEFLGNLTIK